jgi:hypothetical protein
MKTTRILTLIGLFLSVFAIVSCHKNDVLSADQDETASSSIVENSIPASSMPECNTHCISPEGPYIELSGSQTHNYGNPSNPHSKTVSYVAYNTATSFIVNVTFIHSSGNASDLVSVTALGETKSVTTLASGATTTFTFALPQGWTACTNVPFSIRQEGQSAPMDISASYNLYGICAPKGCETSFSGETIDCDNQLREAVYTFTSADDLSYFKIQGGLTNFTGGSAEVTVDGGITTDDQWTPGGSTNRVIKVEGSVTACETITIRIKWSSTNSSGIITGNWSVKDQNGVEIAPAVEGLTCSN